MSDTGKVYGKSAPDPDMTAITGPMDFGTQTPAHRLEDLPLMPPVPPPGIADTMVDGKIPMYRPDPYEPFTRAEEMQRQADWEAANGEQTHEWPGPQHVTPGKVIRDDTHLREVIRDELGTGDSPFEAGMRVAEQHPTIDGVRMELGDVIDMTASIPVDPYQVPTEFLPHNIFDMVTTSQFGIRYKMKNGGVYISRWFPLGQYADEYRKLMKILEEYGEFGDGRGYMMFAVEEGMVALNVAEIESFTFFSRQWFETEYQQRRAR